MFGLDRAKIILFWSDSVDIMFGLVGTGEVIKDLFRMLHLMLWKYLVVASAINAYVNVKQEKSGL